LSIASALTLQQRADLKAFLESLTDEDFLHNPEFSNPWASHIEVNAPTFDGGSNGEELFVEAADLVLSFDEVNLQNPVTLLSLFIRRTHEQVEVGMT